MTIYYVQSNYIIADRYPNSDYNTYNDMTQLNGVPTLTDSDTSFVLNPMLKSLPSQLLYSQDFGYDQYVANGIRFQPVYILYNKLYQNNNIL